MVFSKPSTLLLLVAGAAAQFITPPTDLTTKEGYAGINVRYKEVPAGICELDPQFKSYSGYADVEKDQHIFFWFFEARNQDPSEAPLTVWINGGPGSSSMIGLFQELGPCGIGPDLKPFNNPYSWTNASNMLFIDQPTTTGFSYSIPVPGYTMENGTFVQLANNTCPPGAKGCGTYSVSDTSLTANTTQGAAPNMWKTLQGFMGVFPQYARKEFNFATESYGGHYAPVFNEYILEQNAKDIPGAHKINLQNVLIGNGWYDPLIQYPAFYNYSINPGNPYDISPYNDTVKQQWYNNTYGPDNCVDMTKQCYATGNDTICSNSDNWCYQNVEYLFDQYTGRDEYDMRYLTPNPFPYGYFDQYLNLPEVQAAVGAFQNYSESSNVVGTAFNATGDDDRESNTVEDCKKLLASGVQLTMYFGDADYVCNWIGGQVVAEEIAAPGFDKAGFANISTSDNIVHGQVKQSGLFSFVRIYEAGHEVPFFQPLAALEMFERVINRLDIETGCEEICDEYMTQGTPTSTFKEGNATVQNSITPANATYNTALNAPDPVPTWSALGNGQNTKKRAAKEFARANKWLNRKW